MFNILSKFTSKRESSTLKLFCTNQPIRSNRKFNTYLLLHLILFHCQNYQQFVLYHHHANKRAGQRSDQPIPLTSHCLKHLHDTMQRIQHHPEKWYALIHAKTKTRIQCIHFHIAIQCLHIINSKGGNRDSYREKIKKFQRDFLVNLPWKVAIFQKFTVKFQLFDINSM